jgi:predicted metalloprotease with PDZ domain
MMTVRRLAVALALGAFVSLEAHAQQLEPIRYVVRIPEPTTHYMEVEATYPTAGKPSVELMMAVWTPGSYLVREFARNIEGVAARSPSGATLDIQKTRKNRWLVQTGGAEQVVVSYRAYGHERAGRLNWIEGEFGLINGAPTFITLAERAHRPHDVTLQLPAGWARSITAMPAAAGRDHYRAADYDMLVDSPIVAGNPTVYDFTVDGIRHSLVNVAVGPADSIWNGPRSAADAERIVRSARAYWGALPYARYIFFNFLFVS